MTNISLNKEPISIKKGIKYIIIDALYIEDIKDNLSGLDNNHLLNDIRTKVFPYADYPLLEYNSKGDIIELSQIKKADYNQIDDKKDNIFSTDTGVIIIINEKIFIDFLRKFDYNKLVDSNIEIINLDYWKELTNKYSPMDIAIIVSAGIDSGTDFEGSGIYKIL